MMDLLGLILAFLRGCYDLRDINDVIEWHLRNNGHHVNEEEFPITLMENNNTLKSVLTLESGYQVDLQPRNSISDLLGFRKAVYTNPYNESEKGVDIMHINSILINTNIISGAYLNGTQQPTIYSFFPEVSPGFKIIERPINLTYLPITLSTISSMQTFITDQDGKDLSLRGERVTIRFHIREA